MLKKTGVGELPDLSAPQLNFPLQHSVTTQYSNCKPHRSMLLRIPCKRLICLLWMLLTSQEATPGYLLASLCNYMQQKVYFKVYICLHYGPCSQSEGWRSVEGQIGLVKSLSHTAVVHLSPSFSAASERHRETERERGRDRERGREGECDSMSSALSVVLICSEVYW